MDTTIELDQKVAYNEAMPLVDIPPAKEIDLKELCRQLQNILRMSEDQMCQELDVDKKSFQRWFSSQREPSNQPTARLFLLKQKAEEQFNISVRIPLKDKRT